MYYPIQGRLLYFTKKDSSYSNAKKGSKMQKIQ